MKRITPAMIAATVLTGAVVGIAGVLAGDFFAGRQGSGSDLLGLPESAEQVQLYPRGGQQDFTTAHAYLRGLNLYSRPFNRQKKTNGNFVDVYPRADLTTEFSLEWYPTPSGVPDRLKVATVYAADGTTPIAQVFFRRDGTREKRWLVLDDGSTQTTTYYGDGRSHEDETVTGLPHRYDTVKHLLRETRWREDGTVSYSNVMNPDNSRDIGFWDKNGQPLTIAHLTDGLDGSTMTGYYPGTALVRFSLTASLWQADANYLRKDGTLEKTVVIGPNSVDVTYFDAKGKIVTLKQTWAFDAVEQDDISHMTNMHLTMVTQYDGQGVPKRRWLWTSDSRRLWSYYDLNTVVNDPNTGKPVLCKRVAYFYGEDGSLRVDYTPADSKIDDWYKQYTAADHVSAPVVPSAVLVDPQLDPDLPVPVGWAWG